MGNMLVWGEVGDVGTHVVEVRVGTHEAIVFLPKQGDFIHRIAEVLGHDKLGARLDVLKEAGLARRHQRLVVNVFYTVVADQMVRHTLEGDADCLLDESPFFEQIRVHQRTDQRPFWVSGDGARV